MENLKSAEIYLISGGACKTEVTALSSQANALLEKVPKPLPGTCTVTPAYMAMLKAIGGNVIGDEKNLQVTIMGMKIVCKCSDEYSNDIFVTNSYKGEL